MNEIMDNKDIATVSRTKAIMQRFDLHTKKGFGQNFITDPNVVRKIARECNLKERSVAIEIGPGIGALTEQLAKLAYKVVAYEIDERLLEVLEYSLAAYNNIEIRLQDFLSVDVLAVVNELKKEADEVIVAANLPYYITTPLLFHIFESGSCIDRIVVMMQKEVADRFAANINTKDYNALSVITQYLYDVRIVMKVNKNVFEPKPNVDSAVVEFKRKEIINPVANKADFFALVKACFTQRRKTIYNNYQLFTKDKKQAEINLLAANIPLNARGESVSLEKFINLYQIHQKNLCK